MSYMQIKEGYKLERFVLGPLRTNCYVIINKQGDAVIIDPGYNDRHFIKTLAAENFKPVMVLLTHGHFDHIRGLSCFPDLPVYIHSLDKEMLTDDEKNAAAAFRSTVDYKPKNIVTFEDGDEIKFGDEAFKVINTPGHSKGSSIFLFGGNMLFTGDAIFKGSVGRYDGFGSSEDETKKSVKKIKSLKGDYLMYPGHGEQTTLDGERLTNPFFGEW